MFKEIDLILSEEAFNGPVQMALDEILLRNVGKATLRVYRWNARWITFGYFQKMADVIAAHPGVPSVRRWTGGGIVEHGNHNQTDLTFSLVIPKGDPLAILPPRNFYKMLHGRIGEWLSNHLCSEVYLAGIHEIHNGSSCFKAPAIDDLMMKGRKILGGAQRRSAGAFLYQGSIQGIGVEVQSLQDNLGLAHALAPKVLPTSLSSTFKEKALGLAEDRYLTRSWNELF